MQVEQQPDGSLLIREGWWVLRSATLLGAVLLVALGINTQDVIAGSVFAAVLVVVGALVQDSTFTFDRSARVVRWKRRRLFTVATGEIPFADITDVVYRQSLGIDSGERRPTYRLALATRTGDVFLSATHSIAKRDYESLAETVRGVLRA